MLSLKVQFNLTYQESQPGHSWHRAPETCRSSRNSVILCEFRHPGVPAALSSSQSGSARGLCLPFPAVPRPHHHHHQHQHPSPSPPATALAAPCHPGPPAPRAGLLVGSPRPGAGACGATGVPHHQHHHNRPLSSAPPRTGGDPMRCWGARPRSREGVAPPSPCLLTWGGERLFSRS